MALRPGTRLGPYEIAAQIGVGGMGEVYRARDTRLKREVALKIADTIGAVIHKEPDWTALPAGTPPSIHRLLRRCLAKNAKLRLREAGSAILDIDDASTSADQTLEQPSSSPRPHVWQRAWAVAAIALVVAVAAGVTVWRLTRPAGLPAQVVRFAIPLQDGARFTGTGQRVVAVSPDGSRVVYAADNRLYVRGLDQMQAAPLRGTESAGVGSSGLSPFFSPDGRWIAFWAEGALRRIAVSGGAPVTICSTGRPLGPWWGDDGTILFGQDQSGIWQVPSSGGKPEVLIKVDEGEVAASPQRLPDGDWVLFTLRPKGATTWDQAQIVVQSVTNGQRHIVVDGGRDARYVSTGHLVYASNGILYAVPFDLDTRQVAGGAVSLVEGVGDAGALSADTHFSIAANGSLVYAVGTADVFAPQTFVWVDRTGRETPVPFRTRPYQEFNLSPDGTRIAVRINDAENDVWIYDFARQIETRLTFDPGTEVFPTWTLYGRHVAFGGRGFSLSWRAADGTGQVDVLAENRDDESFRVPQAFTPDGKVLVFEERPNGSPNDIRIGWVGLDGGKTVATLPNDTRSPQRNAALSPDGRWLAYESYESGTAEVYVRPFPEVNGGRWQISSGGGRWPLWNSSRGRTELFYLGAKGLLATAVTTTPVFVPGATTFLLQTASYTATGTDAGSNRRYAVATDGQRFLFLKGTTATSDNASQRLMFVEHWFEELKQRVPRTTQKVRR